MAWSRHRRTDSSDRRAWTRPSSRSLHDAFKKAMEDPKHVELLEQLNQDAWYRSGDDYAKWARETFVKDKALIERLGLAAK